MRAFLNIAVYTLFYIDLFMIAGLFNLEQILALTMVGVYLLGLVVLIVGGRGRNLLHEDVFNKRKQPVHELMWLAAAAPVIYIIQRNKRTIGEVAGVFLAWPPVILLQPFYLLHYALARRVLLKHW
jgi:hypothetical protein